MFSTSSPSVFTAKSLLAAAAALMISSPVCAIETRVMSDESFAHFQQGESTGTEILSDGILRIAPEARRLEKTDESVGWRVAVDRVDGQVFYATGHEGKIYRHVPGKTPELWAKLTEGQAISLAIDPTGGLIVGASPGGKIYRIVEKDKPQLLFDTKEQYVWDLIFDRDGVLYAATGPNGKIYRVRGANNGEVYYDSDATNIMSLDFDAQGRLLASTQGRGMVLRVTGPNEAYVIYTSSDDEVRGLASEQHSGIVYAAVNGVRASSPLFDRPSSDPKSTTSPSSTAPESSSGSATREASSPSYLVQIQPSGFVSNFWPAPEAPIHAVMVDPTTSGSILVAAGKKGRLYRVSANSDYSILADVDEPMVLSIAAGPAGETYFTTAKKASLYRLENARRSGLFESRALNAGSTVQWGNLSLEADLTSGAGVLVETRTGNTPDPTDRTWSPYTTAPLSAGRYAKIASPVAQYLQYRLTLTAPAQDADSGPALDRVQIFYLQRNAPPVVRDVDVTKQGEAGSPSMSTLALLTAASQRSASSSSARPSGSGSESDSDRSGSSLSRSYSSSSPSRSGSSLFSSSGSSSSSSPDGRAAGAGPAENSKRFRISWDANDPNDDRLLSTVWLKGEDEGIWRLVEQELPSPSHTLSTEFLADGKYRVRVDVTDSPENPETAATTTSLVSQSFTVDNTPPTILRLEGKPTGKPGQWEITAEAEDATSILYAGDYSAGEIDKFRAVLPEDGVFDFPRESFRFLVTPTGPGSEHVLTLRVYDREGNMQVAKVILR